MTKHRCVLPFHHMAVRPDGGIKPCCYFRDEYVPNDLTIEHADPFHHPFMNEIRDKMSRDEYVDGCSKCYQDEEASGSSMRLDMNDPKIEFGLPVNKGEEVKLTNLDWAFSNVCNNKCRMCGPELSTQWYSDAKKMNYGFDHRGVIAKNTILDNYNLKDLRFIKMLGGEPLMEQDKFIQMLNKCDLPKLRILLVTNTTLRPNNELTNLLKQCQYINITFSIDSYGSINDFLRKGSKWKTVEENLIWYKETFKNKLVEIAVHSIASIYNINLIDELIMFCLKENLYHNYVVVDGPNWIMPRHIPDSIKQELIIRLEKQASNSKNKIYNLLIQELNQPGDFGMFIRNDIRLNKIRNESWEHLNPWLYKRIQPYITDDIL